MSDLNDDLLNYEIGDIDDNDLTGADEDELLLSDDEIFPEKLSQEEEEHLLSESEEKINKENVEQDEKVEISDKESGSITKSTETAASEKSIIESETVAEIEKSDEKSEDIVPSTNDIPEQNAELNDDNVTEQYSNEIEQVQEEQTEKINSNEKLVENDVVVTEGSVIVSDNKNAGENAGTIDSQATILSSQLSTEESSFDNSMRVDVTEFDADDSDEVSERQNRRLFSEREPQPSPPQLEQNRSSHQHPFQRGPRPAGHMQAGRSRFLGPNQYRALLNEISRPQSFNQVPPPGQQIGPMNRHPMHPRMDFLPGHTIGVMRPFIRIPMRPGMPLPPQGRLPGPHLSHPNQSGPGPGSMQQPPRMQGPPFPAVSGPGNPNRPPFQQFSNSGIPPNQAPNAVRMQQRVPFVGRPNFIPPNNHPGNMIIHRTQLPLPHQMIQNANVGPGQLSGQPPAMPPQPIGRKVLLNPNFKGGVQAATNQLMRDTQYFAVNQEAELLRQQEAFINQNRLHIEKRRRSRERSPDRERSYSPPSRRRPYSPERDSRRPYNSYRGGQNFRNRRANSRENDNFQAKRRRSRSFERDNNDNNEKNDSKTEEDEETRAYRIEIEKQKAMREKILKDKEMRRRKALEGSKTKDEEKKTTDEPQKLTPIIVTEKKIISLKRKSITSTDPELQIESKQSPPAAKQLKVVTAVEARKIPTAAILPETKRQDVTTAVVKPVIKKTITNKPAIPLKKEEEIEEFDEDELLADSPPDPSSPIKTKVLTKTITANVTTSIATTAAANSGGIFSNRRVIMRNSDLGNTSSDLKQETGEANKTNQPHKGIFDRLDKKVIGVNEAAKRKIQRIVINNSQQHGSQN